MNMSIEWQNGYKQALRDAAIAAGLVSMGAKEAIEKLPGQERPIVTKSEAARICGVDVRTFTAWERKGLISRVTHLSNRTCARYRTADLNRLISAAGVS